ncbi:hypothetical protein BSK48_17100 [Paenibacillus odorifer]|uniref:hypothetical protein n=1 Tax=Paenibacillus odorifer TaxID=189426 RepID=UPI00096C17B7|nr:hypothetical protein [Paenibacillus odorifer]OMD69193.1 hypothetical protein BSK48_17100 [Paenibacillus odorifer]
MAIIVNIETNSGIIASKAYARIASFSGTKAQLSVILEYFINQQAAEGNKESLMSEQFYFTPSVEDGSYNFIRQGYEYLKSLPKFKDALDVIE